MDPRIKPSRPQFGVLPGKFVTLHHRHTATDCAIPHFGWVRLANAFGKQRPVMVVEPSKIHGRQTHIPLEGLWA